MVHTVSSSNMFSHYQLLQTKLLHGVLEALRRFLLDFERQRVFCVHGINSPLCLCRPHSAKCWAAVTRTPFDDVRYAFCEVCGEIHGWGRYVLLYLVCNVFSVGGSSTGSAALFALGITKPVSCKGFCVFLYGNNLIRLNCTWRQALWHYKSWCIHLLLHWFRIVNVWSVILSTKFEKYFPVVWNVMMFFTSQIPHLINVCDVFKSSLFSFLCLAYNPSSNSLNLQYKSFPRFIQHSLTFWIFDGNEGKSWPFLLMLYIKLANRCAEREHKYSDRLICRLPDALIIKSW